MIPEDKICKTCKHELVWQGSVMGGKMVCPNSYCVSNSPEPQFKSANIKLLANAEELEYDAADD